MPNLRESFQGKLEGIYSALPVPFSEDGSIDERKFRSNVEALAEAGIDGVYTTDSTGEFWAFELNEFKRVVQLLANATKGSRLSSQVGCTWINTSGVIDRAKFVSDQGISMVHVALPFWIGLTDDEILRFCIDVGKACPDIGLIHYNSARAKRYLKGSDYRRLIDEIPNLIGTKFTGSDVVTWMELLFFAPELIHFVTDSFLLPGMMFGAKGVYSAFVNMNPITYRHLYDSCRNQNWAEARGRFQQMSDFLVELVLPLLNGGHWDPVVDKILAESAGFLQGTRQPRPPYLTISQTEFDHFRQLLRTKYPEFTWEVNRENGKNSVGPA